ncbi:MAG: TolC family protein [Proteobacteria bacterium]|nr:TolC family protein [Pseudomonadota bacterium]
MIRPLLYAIRYTLSAISRCTLYALSLLIVFPQPALPAQTLDFESVVEEALKNAHDVRISGLDIQISTSARKKAYSLYYPTLSAKWNSEYVKDLTGGTAQQVTAVGNTVVVENTMYQSLLSVAASYNLFDFGSTGKKVLIANKDVDVKRTIHNQSIRDIKLKVLSLYSDMLISFKEFESKKELLALYKELSLTKERLFNAGTISKLEMVDEALKVVKTVDAIENLKLKVKTLLQDISFYTGDKYDAEGLFVSDFAGYDEDFRGDFNAEKSPEAKIYNLEIEKKKAELEVLKNDQLPQFGLYSSYMLYGSDLNRYGDAVTSIKPRNYFVGISATWPLFEGFKTTADMEKATLEIERLKTEKNKKLAELTSRYNKTDEARRTYTGGIENQKEMVTKVQANLSMSERLVEQKVTEWVDFLNRKAELVNQRFELAKAIVTRVSAVKELNILAEEVR